MSSSSSSNRRLTKRKPRRDQNTNMAATRMSNPIRNQFSRSHMIVPPIYRTSCGIDYFGYHSSGLNKVTFAVSANSLHLPFNSALIVTNSLSINAAGFSPYTGSVYTTMQPQGFTNLCGSAAPYLNYRVLSSKIGLKLIPITEADTVVATINQVSTGEQWNTNVWTGSEAPYASGTCVYTVSESNRQLTQRFTSAEAFGVPEIAIRDNLSYAGSFNTSPENEWNWILNIQTVNTDSTQYIGIFLEVQYDVEFFNPATGGLNDV
jgi:hypothetical protein